MTVRSIRLFLPLVVSGTGLCLLGVTACSSGSSAAPSGNGTAVSAASTAASTTAAAATAAGGAASATGNPCTLVTAAELSQAVGVHYASISGSGGLCDRAGWGGVARAPDGAARAGKPANRAFVGHAP